MEKAFNEWSTFKQRIHSSKTRIFAHPREVWWCSLGINVGSEIDGKNVNFERPILVMRVYNTETLLVLPVTSKEKRDVFHQEITSHGRMVWVSLTQLRVISSKRLLRKVDIIPVEEFARVKNALTNFL